eukprot:scaffold9600_cov132-Isochrysis_galbana.AAC.5
MAMGMGFTGHVFFFKYYLAVSCKRKRTRAQPSAISTLPGPGNPAKYSPRCTLHLVGAAGLPRGPTMYGYSHIGPGPASSIHAP